MSSLREQIYATWDLRETEDLLSVWQANDRVEWPDQVFEMIEDILKKRGVDIPQQNPAILTHESKKEKEVKILSEQERKIASYENQPEFYDPIRVLKISKWLNIAAKIMVVLVIIRNLVSFQYFIGLARTYFYKSPYPIIVLGGFLILGIGVAIEALIYYLPLVAFSHILRILMDMDFKSRKAQ